MTGRSPRRALASSLSEARDALSRGKRKLGPHAVAEDPAGLAEAAAALSGADEARIANAGSALDAAWARHLEAHRKSALREYAEVVVIAVALAALLRLFVAEAYRIPSGSMAPTLLPGDQILVSKLAYGLRLPLGGRVLWERPGPARGDLVVFVSPNDPAKVFVKRVVGLAGEEITVVGEVVHVDGVPQPRARVVDRLDFWNLREELGAWHHETGRVYLEELGGRRHLTLQSPTLSSDRPAEGPFAVPPGHVFVVGDNRDDSDDGRSGRGWYVPLENVKGEAVLVWLSRGRRGDGTDGLRWDRLGLPIDGRIPDAEERAELEAAAAEVAASVP